MVGDLPAMPAVVSEVLRITEDPKVDMQNVGRVIESDPAMAGKILKVSNSSYYGMKQFVGTLKMALVILGVREVRNIVLGISVFEAFKDGRTDVKLTQQVWDDSLKLAGLCKKLAAGMILGLQGEEFICGLLANIGQIVMLKEFGKEYSDVLLDLGSDTTALCNAETELFDFTHAEAASALAARWNLPQVMIDALWCQYPNDTRAVNACAEPKLTAALRIARAAQNDNFDDPNATPKALRDEEAWAVLTTHARNPVAPELRRATLLGFLQEIASAPPVPL